MAGLTLFGGHNCLNWLGVARCDWSDKSVSARAPVVCPVKEVCVCVCVCVVGKEGGGGGGVTSGAIIVGIFGEEGLADYSERGERKRDRYR